MKVKNYNPFDLTGARSYFTGFDHRIVQKQENLEIYRKRIERILKVALLSKGTIVIAASHLTNDFTYAILSENPVLLNQEILIPALRKDVDGLPELFQKYQATTIEKNRILEFYNSNIESFVRWDLASNSEWFRQRFIGELQEPNSVLRRNLGYIPGSFITDALAAITGAGEFQRDIIDSIAEELPASEDKNRRQRVLKDFRELLYHISGARVVNCESALPQENYLDYSLADMQERKTVLSDTDIFWKMLVELVLNSLKTRLLSIEELDYLSFDKIVQIRDSINKEGFRDAYEKLLNLSVGHFDEHALLKNFEELMDIREKLASDFTKVINTQLNEFVKKERKLMKKKLLGNGFSLANGIAGLSQAISPYSAALGLAKDGAETCMNLYENYNTANDIKNLDSFIDSRRAFFTKRIMETEISNKSVFIDAVKLLSRAIADSFQISPL